MASTISRHIMVKAPPREVANLVRAWWEDLAYDKKQVKLDTLPVRFWGTFTDRAGSSAPSSTGSPCKTLEQCVHFTVSIQDAATAGEFSLGTGYGRQFIKINCLIPDPVLGDRTKEYMKQFIDGMQFRLKEMGVPVEIPDA